MEDFKCDEIVQQINALKYRCFITYYAKVMEDRNLKRIVEDLQFCVYERKLNFETGGGNWT